MASPAPPPRRSRRNLTYGEKLVIIQKKEEEPAWTQRNLALWAKEAFRLESKPTQATISNLLRDKDKLLSAVVPPGFRSARKVKYPELDQMVLHWVHAELERGECMTRSSVQTKAVEIAQEMQLPSDLSFSKGWVSSFMSRHQLNFSKKIREQGTPRQNMLAVTTEAINRTGQVRVQQVHEETDEEEEEVAEETEEVEVDNAVEVEEEQTEQVQESSRETSIAEDDYSAPRQTVKRRRMDSGGDSAWLSREEEERVMKELLLDWIAVPGSYSRWWLLKSDEEKEPLCDEIKLFLRSHGLHNVGSVDIRQQLTAFVATFQAAQKWLRQARVDYPLNVAEMTLEQEEVKSHVLQMCPYYERLVSVLAPYVNYDDSSASVAQSADTPATATLKSATPSNSNSTPRIQTNDTAVAANSPAKPAKISQRQSTESNTEDNSDDETKAQKRHLFKLECARLQSEIETRNVQLVVEKTLARKKLLDAGISPEEVDRIFPL
ncbi:Tc5 transposase DNA-binding domain [Phytophthora infestans]|uniref:Tc5 transposase DNA-binding domain n=1 Tax=Phytophthora infestans TaxID=4787 RepID=A0A8S9UDD6_PHYIN|nr:Tc5 transposase DNA-binding domain [Phytophthora infestans]